MKGTIRWWPPVLLLTLAAVGIGWVWSDDGVIRQQHVLRSIVIGFVAAMGLLFWAVLFSGLSRKRRLALLAVFLTVAVGAGVSIRITGVSGDLVPILDWRWARAAQGPGALADAGDVSLSSPDDFPQFLGATRDGRVSGVELETDWEAQPPREIWRRPIGPGWAGFAVAGDLAITMEQRGQEELVVAYSMSTGEPYWLHAYEARYETVIGGVGPRTVPTVADGRVFTLGATAILTALDLATGRELWKHDLRADYSTTTPDWGKSGAPLVVDDMVIVSAGGVDDRSLVAYGTADGELVWGGGTDRSGYSSPILVTLAGREQIVMFNQSTVVGHDPTTGKVLWSYPWSREQPNVSVPLPLDEESLFVSSGYGVGGKRLRVSGDSDRGYEAELIWETPRLKAKFANSVLHEGSIYGLDDGVLVCLDPDTGERRWKRGRYGHGQLLLVGDILLVQTERGEVVLVEATPEEHRELARLEVFEEKTWNPPALAGRHLVMRNHKEAVVYELPIRGSSLP